MGLLVPTAPSTQLDVLLKTFSYSEQILSLVLMLLFVFLTLDFCIIKQCSYAPVIFLVAIGSSFPVLISIFALCV